MSKQNRMSMSGRFSTNNNNGDDGFHKFSVRSTFEQRPKTVGAKPVDSAPGSIWTSDLPIGAARKKFFGKVSKDEQAFFFVESKGNV
jgi:hypothetical protein